MHRLTTVLAPMFLAATSSCATMFGGTSSEIEFTSSLPNTSVRIGEESYACPANVVVRKRTKRVTFIHPEYGEIDVELDRSFHGGYLLMDVLFSPGFGLVGILVDTSTGAFFSFPATVHHDFEAATPGVE